MSLVSNGNSRGSCQILRRVLSWLWQTCFLVLANMGASFMSSSLGWWESNLRILTSRVQDPCQEAGCSRLPSPTSRWWHSCVRVFGDELPILSYFEETWIGAPAGGRRMPPKFCLHLWNVHDRSYTGLAGGLSSTRWSHVNTLVVVAASPEEEVWIWLKAPSSRYIYISTQPCGRNNISHAPSLLACDISCLRGR